MLYLCYNAGLCLPQAPWKNEATAPPPTWPEQGVIQLQDYSTRYREGLDLVLKNVSLNIKSNEKLGICGRTGNFVFKYNKI